MRKSQVYVAVAGLFVATLAAPEKTEAAGSATTGAQDGRTAPAGFDHGFYIRSADGAFEFRPFGLIHADFRLFPAGDQINTDDTQASTFVARRLRLGFEGKMYEDTGFDLETNVGSGGAELIFAWLNFAWLRPAQVRVGHFKEPFSYEVLLPEKYLDFIERSIVATVVSPAEDTGVMVHNFGSPLGGVLEYGVGIFNGLGGAAERKNPEKSFEYAARLAVHPFGASTHRVVKQLRLAGYGLLESDRPEGIEIRPRTPLGFEFFPRIATAGSRLAYGGDIQWIYGPVSLKAEFIRDIEERAAADVDAVVQGWHADATWLVTGEEKVRAMESGIELAARIEKLEVDAGSPVNVAGFVDENGGPVYLEKNHVTTLTVGANWFVNYNVKFQLNYQNDWFGNAIFTPDSRRGDTLRQAAVSRWKFLARVQLFF